IIPVSKNKFYICATRLYEFDLKTGKTQPVKLTVTEPENLQAKPQDFYNNVLWNDSIMFSCRRTTDEAGLRKINLNKHTVKYFKTSSKNLSPYFPQANAINTIMMDSYDRIWCASEAGVDIFYP